MIVVLWSYSAGRNRFTTFRGPLKKVASVRSTYEMHAFNFEQLLIVDISQLKVASLRAP